MNIRYIGWGTVNPRNNCYINGRIYLDKIPDDAIKRDKNNRPFVEVTIFDKKGVDDYGTTHAIHIWDRVESKDDEPDLLV